MPFHRTPLALKLRTFQSDILNPFLGAALPGIAAPLEAIDIARSTTAFVREAPMGFFSSILKTVVGVGRGLLGLAPKAIPAAARVVRAAPRIALGTAAAVAGGAAFAGGQALLGGAAAAPGAAGAAGFVINPATGELVAPGGGNGVLATTTMVTTVNRLTGQIVKQRIFVGSPFIMNKEVAHLKSTIKKLRRGAGKIPTRTRDPSLNSEINSAIKHSILHQAQRGAALALHGNPKDG